MAKRAKGKKKSVVVDEDARDPGVSYAIPAHPTTKTFADAIAECAEAQKPITDAELESLLKKPDWIWAGMFVSVAKMVARIKGDSGKKTKPVVGPLD